MSIARGCSLPKCPTAGAAVTENPIRGSVGMKGHNNPADVKTVQQFLNAVPQMKGGPDVLLAEDGLCGPKTQAAISKYQSKVLNRSDGRVDPQGPTIKLLTQYIVGTPAVPYGKVGAPPGGGAPTSGTIAQDSIADAQAGMRVVEPALHRLRWQLVHASPGMMALLNKHFSNNKDKFVVGDIAHIQKILAGVHFYVARFNAFGKLPVDNVFLFDQAGKMAAEGVIAWTVRGGDKMSTNQIQIYESQGGVVTKNPGQSIWLTRLFAEQTRLEKQWTVLHEFSHFVGSRDGSYNEVDDNAYAFQHKFLSLSKFERMHNAESLSLFFLEYCVGTRAILSMPGLVDVKPHFEQFPHVSPTGEVTLSSLPDSWRTGLP